MIGSSVVLFAGIPQLSDAVINRFDTFNQLEQGRRMTFIDAAGKAEEISVPQEYLYLGEVQDMHAAILDGVDSYLSLSETRNHVRTVLGLYESAKIGKTVTLK